MVNNIVSVDTITLVGGPATVAVNLDFGPQGDRGSLILYGLGKPNTIPLEDFSFPPQLLDWYINLKTTDNEYLYLYQYVSEDGTNTWRRIFKIIPNVFNTNELVTFTEGQAVLNIPISNTTLALLPGVDFADFTLNTHVDLEVTPSTPLEETYPMIPGFRILGTSIDQETGYNLDILVTGLEVVPTGNPLAPYAPQPINGTRIVHLSINVI